MSVVVQDPTAKVYVHPNDMKIGQIGKFEYCGGEHIVIKGYDTLLSLTDPRTVFDKLARVDQKYKVELLPTDTKVTYEYTPRDDA